MDSGIYAIRHTKTGRCYIGSSVRLTNRWYQHRRILNKGTHHAAHLQHAWSKYGPDAFAFRVLEECAPDKATLLAREQHYIDTLHPVFNYAKHAGSRLGVPVSEKSKAQISAAMMGRPKPWLKKTHCKRGHAFDEVNLRVDPRSGQWICRACAVLRERIYKPLRGKIKPTCRRGHPWTPESTTNLANGTRTCRICLNERERRVQQRRRDAWRRLPPQERGHAVIRTPTAHCKNGHERTPENTKLRSYGKRTCRICFNEREREAYAAGRRA